MKNQLKTLSAAFVSLGLIAGCTPNISPTHYDTGSTQQVSTVLHGTIIDVSQVNVSNSNSGNWTGAIGGGLAGAVAGSAVGGGTGSALMAVGGGLLGAVAGKAAEEKLSEQTATQYIVQLTNGSTVSITQGGEPMAVGTKVILLQGNPARLLVDTTTGLPTTASSHS